ASTEICPLSLHDALPILSKSRMSSSEASCRRGLLFIVSAPSGAGKTTLVERLVEQTPGLRMSRSYTSRAARAGETDGVDYNFVRSEEHTSELQSPCNLVC